MNESEAFVTVVFVVAAVLYLCGGRAFDALLRICREREARQRKERHE